MMSGVHANEPAKSARDEGQAPLLQATRPAMRFCWHLRAGMFRGIEHDRIRAYSEFFFNVYLDPYLRRQETLLPGVSGLDAVVLRKAKASQRKLRKLFAGPGDMNRFVGLVEDKLEEHVRFVHKTLLPELRSNLSAPLFSCMQNTELVNDREACRRLSNWEDRFWELR